ncbi:MAG: hypothetical protein AB7P00_20040 [Sandaracinaceae bacterium]
MTLGALHFATMTNAELVERGVPTDVVTAERERRTGHVRRIQPRWARTIGLWGGVADLQTIAERVDVEVAAAREDARYRGLRWRTKHRAFTAAQLAVLSLASTGTSREAAARLGVLPVEACMYRAAATELLVHSQASLPVVLRWSPRDLERAWQELDLRVAAPEREQRSIHEPGYLERIVAEAERWVTDHPEDEP